MSSTAVTLPKTFGPIAKAFAKGDFNNDLASGIVSGLGVVSLRGKVWRVKFGGEERVLLREDGDGPRSSIEVVIVKAAPHVSKVFYEDGYQEGSAAAPDCWSSNSITPDASAPKRQSNACASCKQNAIGSRVSTTGKSARACSDSKRLAIVPLEDIENEQYGGPMLLRVPAASLGTVQKFAQHMQSLGYPYNSIGIRLSFDMDEAYPKLVLTAIRPLDDIEAAKIVELQTDPRVARILAENSEHEAGPAEAAAPEKPDPVAIFEQPPQPKAAAPKKAAAKAAAPAPVVKEAAPPTAFDDELDAELDKLI